MNAKTELAVRYNNQSPLENHHCAIAFQILDKAELNIFANVDQMKQKAIRDVSSTIIQAYTNTHVSIARSFYYFICFIFYFCVLISNSIMVETLQTFLIMFLWRVEQVSLAVFQP